MEAMDSRQLAIFVIIGLISISAVEAQANQPPQWNKDSVQPLIDGISEDTPVGTFLVQLECIDTDGDRIEYGLSRGKTMLVSRDGKVYLNQPVDFERSDTAGYDSAFTCYDTNPNSGAPIHNPVQIEVELTVNDANDQPPTFTVDSVDGYSFVISEADSAGKVLTPPIRIKDRDRTNNAQLSYLYIICNSPFPAETVDLPESSVATCEKFSLNYTQLDEGDYEANLVLRSGLDFETKRVYSSKLVAIDNPTNHSQRLSTTINIQINVGDAQDVEPRFVNLGESAIVEEESARGTPVSLSISARDGDVGDMRKVKIVMLEDKENAFTLDPSVEVAGDQGVYSASLRVNTSLDREKVGGSYSFVVKAIELDKVTGAETTATATATYSVQVSDINDEPPTFDSPVYYVNVTEMEFTDKPVQLTGLRMVCQDRDVSQNARYDVSILSQTFPDVYSISPGVSFVGTAVLFLKANNLRFLDYDVEQYRSQTVVLVARAQGGSPLSSSATVSIRLIDINDNPPVFGQSSYQLSVSEGITAQQLPFRITTIDATDKDSGLNGDITYRLEGGTNNKFAIDPKTGVLTLVNLVDYETTPLYVFLVYAEDGARNKQRSQVQVTVDVTNVNDEAPVFEQPVYQTTVNEDSLNFLAPIIVSATDSEEGTGRITYRIKSGQTADNAFRLNPTTGELTLQRKLTYQGNGLYEVEIEAQDGGTPPLSSTVKVRISVIDQNNFSPIISPKVYRQTVSELVDPGTFVAKIEGTDQDLGRFGKITYRIVSGGFDNFKIDPDTGRVTINDPQNFDFDQQKEYNVVVIGSDGGAPQLTDNATIIVTITDANNKAPKFTEDIYTKNVDEKENVGFPILTVSATDDDSSKNLFYSIQTSTMIGRNGAGNIITSTFPYDYRQTVEINNKTGVISLKNKVNKQQLLALTFLVQVQDLNARFGNQIDTTRVALTIIGEANIDLTFDRIDQIFVNEGSNVDYEITTVVARDPSNQQGGLTYTQIGQSDFFEVIPTTGEVRLKNKIDYENDPRTHLIVVQARSNDGIRSVSTTVTIKISDENDNAPVFREKEYTANIDEDAPPLTTVVTVLAEDADTSSFGPIRYLIAGGLDADHFDLYESSRGVDVYVARGVTLDYNLRDYYELDIFAVDNAKKQFSNVQLFSSVKLKINVIDKNNHKPMFLNADAETRRFAVAETAEVGKSIGTIVATDDDFGKNGEIIYFLQESNDHPSSARGVRLFSMVERAGILQVSDSLLGFGGNTYTVQVFARDGGEPYQSNTLLVQVEVLRTENNDGNPVWYRPTNNFVFYVDEGVKDVTVKDQKGSPIIFEVAPRTGNKIVYSLSTLSDYVDSFRINSETGVITVVKELDRERKESYNILVFAGDTTDPLNIRSGRQIIIRLIDKNDNPPTFLNLEKYAACGPEVERPIEVSVMENVPSFTNVYNVTACDPDLNDPIYYTFYNVNDYCRERNQVASQVFDMDINGHLTTKILIDYEEYQTFEMCVIAQETKPPRVKRAFDLDRVDQTLHNVAYIQINIQDQNDNKPEFPKDKVTAVMLTEARDYPVVVLDAVDKDARGTVMPVYTIVETKFFPVGQNVARSPGRAFVIKNNALYPDPPRGHTFEEFSGGRFEIRIKAEDPEDSSKFDMQTVVVYVHEEGQALKIILDMTPSNGYALGETIVKKLNDVDDQHFAFRYLHVSVHKDKDGIDQSRTDVCFIAVDSVDHHILNIIDLVRLLDTSSYNSVLRTPEYKFVDRSKCYLSTKSENKVRWRDLWWVLVVVAIFIGVCALIFIAIIFALYRKYRRYMQSEKTYLVPQ